MKLPANQRKAGALLSYVAIAIGFVVSVVYTPIMLRLLGQSEYGLYSLTASIVSYLGLLGFGLTAGYIRFYSRAKAKEDISSISRLNGMFLIVLSVIALTAIALGALISINADAIMNHKLTAVELRKAKILILLLSFNLAATFPAGLANAYITVHECFIFQRVVQIIRNIISPFLIIPILLMGCASVGMAVVTVTVNCSAELIIAHYCLKKLKMRFDFSHFDKKLFFEICVFSSYIFLNIVIDQINWNVDKYLLGIFYSTSAVAVYAVAAQLSTYYNTFSTAISSVFVPRVNMIVSTTDDNKELTLLFARIGRVQLYVVLFVCLGFIFFGRPFIFLWAGANYIDAYTIVLILIIPVIVPLIQNIGIEIQKAKNMHKFRSVVYTLMSFVNLMISIPLCKAYGGIGAAAGTAFALIAANGFIMNWYYHRRIKLDIFYFWREIASTFPAFLPPIFIGVILNRFVDLYKIPYFLASIPIFTLVYGVSVWKLGLNEYEKELLKPLMIKLHIIRLRRNAVMETNRIISDKNECSGCSACFSACPENAITMKSDAEGFLYPSINSKRCINCGLCERICGKLGAETIKNSRAYAACAKDSEIRKSSSSGGIFSLLADNVLQKGGTIYGAAFDEDFAVRHIAVEDINELERLRGSKYVQSSLGSVFMDVKSRLALGKEVLFSGTPCQVAGLKCFLGFEHPGLTTVDVVCHGVPSPRVWKAYVDIMKTGADAPVKRISFRAKNSSWKRYAVSFSYENDTAYLRYHGDDPYMRGFLKDLYLRPSCYNCRFKSNNRTSDITLADFWGIEKVLPEMDDDGGTSLVITNTQKGETLLSEMIDRMLIKEVPIDVVQHYNKAICLSAKVHPRREEFFSGFKDTPADLLNLISKYTKDTLSRRCKNLLRSFLNRMGLMPLARRLSGRK